MKKFLFSLLSAIGMSTGCTAGDSNVLSPSEFSKAISADTTAYIIDVRHESEYADGHIKGAHLLDVLDEAAFADGMKQLDKANTYYIYCRSGRRSHAAWTKLTENGYKAYDLEGGILNWIKEGLPTVK